MKQFCSEHGEQKYPRYTNPISPNLSAKHRGKEGESFVPMCPVDGCEEKLRERQLGNDCCFLGCDKEAGFEVYSESGDTLACSEHLVELICDDEMHCIYHVPEFLEADKK